MTRRLQRFSILSLQMLMAVIVFVQCDAQDTSQQNIIVKMAGSHTISFTELQEYWRDNFYAYRHVNDPAKNFYEALDDKIVNQLKLIDFFTLGLNENAELIQSIKRPISEELVIRYYNTKFYDRYVNEDSIKNAYREMGKEVVYKQIVLLKLQNASRKHLDSLKSLANSIMTKLHNGADFDELARQYSHDRFNASGRFDAASELESKSHEPYILHDFSSSG